MFPSFNARAIGRTLAAAETVEVAARAGFGGVDLLVRDLLAAGESPEELRRRMDDLGLVGGAFPMPVAWRGDESAFRRDLDDLPRLLDAAATLGLRRTATWVMPEIPEALAHLGPDARAATIDFHLERLSAIAAMLARCEIRLGLEALGVARLRSGRTPAFMTRLGDLGPVLGPLASSFEGVGLLLDTFHLVASGELLESALALGVGSIVWVHVADLPPGAPRDPGLIEDLERGLPGENGAVDNPGVLRILGERGYEGPVTAEPMARCASLAGLDPDAAAGVVAKALRSVWPRS